MNGDNTANLILRDVTPLSLGTEIYGGIMGVLIPKDTQSPVRREGRYVTTCDNQESIRVSVYEGERPNAEHNNLLGEFALRGLLRAPEGDVGIIETLEIDANGIVKMSAEHKTSGIKEAMIMMNGSSKLSDVEISKMIAEAEKLKIEDQLWKVTVESRNALEEYIYDMRKRLKKEELRGKMEKKDAEHIEAGLDEAGEWVSENENAQKAELVEKMEQVKRLCKDFEEK